MTDPQAEARKLAEDALLIADDISYTNHPILRDVARALLAALGREWEAAETLERIGREAQTIIGNGGVPSPEAFAYLAVLRERHAEQIHALERKVGRAEAAEKALREAEPYLWNSPLEGALDVHARVVEALAAAAGEGTTE